MTHTEMGDPDKVTDVEVGEDEERSEDRLDELPEETVVLPETEDSDNVGDVSVEINVEELVAEIEASQECDAHTKKEIRRRLEDIQEQKEALHEIDDTFDIDLNEDD